MLSSIVGFVGSSNGSYTNGHSVVHSNENCYFNYENKIFYRSIPHQNPESINRVSDKGISLSINTIIRKMFSIDKDYIRKDFNSNRNKTKKEWFMKVDNN